ncbi:hypothetical protein [Rubritalea marina]|uniref:hypothetical protein n=1 Tax=Rubritalea marina TaxID=361055 RepID=UPI0003783A27|nr:hypothetical protein [Rubritalea marina]
MKLRFSLFLLLSGLVSTHAEDASAPAAGEMVDAPLSRLMPVNSDFTSMWWAEGFPGLIENAPWVRCIRTGHYSFYLNTETLEVVHLAGAPSERGYNIYHHVDGPATQFQPAELKLQAVVDGKTYVCAKGGKWSRFEGPRVIVSGKLLQRADVTDLEFVAADGEVLKTESRFETVAWPDRLTFVLAVKPVGAYKDLDLKIQLGNQQGLIQTDTAPENADPVYSKGWKQVSLNFDPAKMLVKQPQTEVQLLANEIATGQERKVRYDQSLASYRVDLDKVKPIVPSFEGATQNDAIERVRVVLKNPSDKPQMVRMIFEKTNTGMAQPIGAPVTGISAMLRDTEGNPTGIPVQLSKNWHTLEEAGIYRNQWFHGVSQMRMPANSQKELELTICYGHWGGVAAASHAQLSLIGWGSNQLWEESAIGAWGESICYEPSQAQADTIVTDVRPLMVSKPDGSGVWQWTNNVGGADFFRLFKPDGTRVVPAAMQALRHRQGPCLTEVTYGGNLEESIWHSTTTSISRSDDIVRGTFKLRMHVHKPVDFSRFVIFQIGSDTYNYTAEKKLAFGDEGGLKREWDATWGGDVYRGEPIKCVGRVPWVSMHDSEQRGKLLPSPWANRGLVIRSWKARLGGKEAPAWIAERGTRLRDMDFSTFDIVPPADVKRLEAGDYVEATVEYLVFPKAADEYYGPNKELKAALEKSANTWELAYREAMGGNYQVSIERGGLIRRHPDLRVMSDKGNLSMQLEGGIGYLPITIMALPTPDQGELLVDGKPLDQSVHGSDFWQTDYDPATQLWSRTYNIPTQVKTSDNIHIEFKHP